MTNYSLFNIGITVQSLYRVSEKTRELHKKFLYTQLKNYHSRYSITVELLINYFFGKTFLHLSFLNDCVYREEWEINVKTNIM